VVTLCIRCGRLRSQQGFTSLQSEENALFSAGRVRHVTASSERIARELGWRATVPFAAGVAEFAASPPGRAVAGRPVPAGRR
jgi:hypothetical protein